MFHSQSFLKEITNFTIAFHDATAMRSDASPHHDCAIYECMRSKHLVLIRTATGNTMANIAIIEATAIDTNLSTTTTKDGSTVNAS